MHCEIDQELRGVVMRFDSVTEMVNEAERCWNKGKAGGALCSFQGSANWVGRKLNNFAEVRRATTDAWAEGLAEIEKIRQQILEADIPQPQSRKRKPRWDEHDGEELDLDRLRQGEDYWRRMRRQRTVGPTTISLLSNLDACAGTDPKDIFWRGGAAIAIADMLENAGYLVDLHIWCLGRGVYSFGDGGKTISQQFTTMNIKKPGETLDFGSVMNTLSGWYLRCVIFNTFNVHRPSRSIGGADFTLGKWVRHMHCSGDKVLVMPVVESLPEAIEAGRQLLREFAGQESKEEGLVEVQNYGLSGSSYGDPE